MAYRPKKSHKMSVYSNLAHNRRMQKDAASRKKAEYLATLPKQPVLRFLYRMHPKRMFHYWFSRQGAIFALKLAGIGILFGVLFVGALFAYYRKDLDAIRPSELAKRVQTTVTVYQDRNGNTLWEDKGDGNYTLTVNGDDISPYMKQATVAIEDKNFYKHSGISVTGIIRSGLNDLNGGSTQGGSTLTQQLVKQVFFADQAQNRGISGIPRKIKEIILAIEVERMYDKDQILNLYLNESPYGGRRNGVESGAQTYFGVKSKDLTLPEAALLAAIPNAPGLYDPYNTAGNPALIARQHKVLDDMVDQKYITQKQADDAKAYPILDHLHPLSDQYKDIKAPHFVEMVRSELESELGKATVGQGGLTVKTTLDLNIQNKLEESMNNMFNSSTPAYAGFTNGAATVEDTQTGQIVAMMGSRDFNYPGFGQDNAALAPIQPGSTIKPFVYSQLFSKQPAGKPNFGSGSILADDNTMSGIYGAPLHDADNKFMGPITIRKALALSRNVPAVKAMYIAGIQPTLKTIREMGNTEYCTLGADAMAGLSAAIGGCGTRQIDLVNAYATLGRMGAYKPISTILEVKNSQGQVIKKFTDTPGKQVIDPQVAYILADILSDDNARAGLYGPHFYGLYIPGVQTAVKTGTSDKGGQPKDIWTASYSPALSMAVWLGNPDTSVLKNGNSSLPAKIIGPVMEYAHKTVYASEGKWKSGDWFTQPAGIQRIGGEVYPSWYDQKQAQSQQTMVFDQVSKKKATDCTPDAAKVNIAVTKVTDPTNKNTTYVASDGYDASADDDFHHCDDAKPQVGSINVQPAGGNKSTISVSVTAGKNTLKDITIAVNGNTVATLPADSSGTYSTTYAFADNSTQTVSATVTDDGYYTDSASVSYTPSVNQPTGYSPPQNPRIRAARFGF